MRNDQTYKEVLIASLLHDIGKFYGRSSTIKSDLHEYGRDVDSGTPHPAISGLFVDRLSEKINEVGLNVETVKTFVEHHHESDSFEKKFRVECR